MNMIANGYTRTWRKGSKWAKLTKHGDGHYSLAQGYQGELEARTVYEFWRYNHAIKYRNAWFEV